MLKAEHTLQIWGIFALLWFGLVWFSLILNFFFSGVPVGDGDVGWMGSAFSGWGFRPSCSGAISWM